MCIRDRTQAKAEPATGFWLQLTGALVLAICGGALATLSPDQLRAFARTVEGGRPSSRWRPSRAAAKSGNPAEEEEAAAGEPRTGAKAKAAKSK